MNNRGTALTSVARQYEGDSVKMEGSRALTSSLRGYLKLAFFMIAELAATTQGFDLNAEWFCWRMASLKLRSVAELSAGIHVTLLDAFLLPKRKFQGTCLVISLVAQTDTVTEVFIFEAG